jgi:hypothetical protein
VLSAGKRLHVAGIDKGRRVEILETNNATEGERVMYNIYIMSGYVTVRHQGSSERRDSLVSITMTAFSWGGVSTLG